jgi:hypothetical protein
LGLEAAALRPDMLGKKTMKKPLEIRQKPQKQLLAH